MRWMLGLMLGCTPPGESVDVPSEGVVVVATAADDFSTGALSVVSMDDATVYGPIAAVSGDPVVQVWEQQVIQINRLGVDTIRVYDPETWGRPSEDFSVGVGSNPHAVARCGQEWWVSLYEQNYLGRFRGGAQQGGIDLSTWADSDGLPETSSMVSVEGTIYAALQRLNRQDGWTPVDTGMVVQLNCEQQVVEADIAVGANPEITRGPNDSVWVVSPQTGVHPLNSDHGESGLDASVFAPYFPERMSVDASGRGLVIAHADQFSGYALYCVDLPANQVTRVLETDSYLSDVVAHQGRAWVAARRSWIDAAAIGGLMIWDVEQCVQVTQDQWISTGLDPVSLAVLP